MMASDKPGTPLVPPKPKTRTSIHRLENPQASSETRSQQLPRLIIPPVFLNSFQNNSSLNIPQACPKPPPPPPKPKPKPDSTGLSYTGTSEARPFSYLCPLAPVDIPQAAQSTSQNAYSFTQPRSNSDVSLPMQKPTPPPKPYPEPAVEQTPESVEESALRPGQEELNPSEENKYYEPLFLPSNSRRSTRKLRVSSKISNLWSKVKMRLPADQMSKMFPRPTASKPTHPEREAEINRLTTFRSWGVNRQPTPQKLAEAGFFYSGSGDSVRCFFCDGRLCNWDENQEPWREHAFWFPSCPFVKQSKGQRFIDAVKHGDNFTRSESDHIYEELPSPASDELPRIPVNEELPRNTVYVNGTLLRTLVNKGQQRTPGYENWPLTPTSGNLPRTSENENLRRIDVNEELPRIPVHEELPRTPESKAREVDASEVMSRMKSAVVQAVLNMDIPVLFVETAIRTRLEENGEGFSTPEALLEAVFKLDIREEYGYTDEGVATGSREAKNTNRDGDLDSEQLADEIRRLKEERICKICLDGEVCITFIPCGHLVCCSGCASVVDQCPICRSKIRGTVRTFMS